MPDVIVMDITLPVMDGWEATRRLKADERTRHIPIIVLTGHAVDRQDEGAPQRRLRRVPREALHAGDARRKSARAAAAAVAPPPPVRGAGP